MRHVTGDTVLYKAQVRYARRLSFGNLVAKRDETEQALSVLNAEIARRASAHEAKQPGRPELPDDDNRRL